MQEQGTKMTPWKIASAILVFVVLFPVFAEDAIPVGNHRYLPEILLGAERIPIGVAEGTRSLALSA